MDVWLSFKTDSNRNDGIGAVTVCVIGKACGPGACGGSWLSRQIRQESPRFPSVIIGSGSGGEEGPKGRQLDYRHDFGFDSLDGVQNRQGGI